VNEPGVFVQMAFGFAVGVAMSSPQAVLKSGAPDTDAEPFVLYRPESLRWEDGFARHHARDAAPDVAIALEREARRRLQAASPL